MFKYAPVHVIKFQCSNVIGMPIYIENGSVNVQNVVLLFIGLYQLYEKKKNTTKELAFIPFFKAAGEIANRQSGEKESDSTSVCECNHITV